MPPQKVSLPDGAWAALIVAAQRDRVFIEGNILKVLDPEDSPSYQGYLDAATAADKDKREKRLQVTKQVQDQNKELLEAQRIIETKTESLESALNEMREAKQETEDALAEAQQAREDAEDARKEAEGAWKEAKNDLDYMQKRTQFELMGRIVRVSLFVIVAVGTITTGMYAMALFGPKANAEDVNLLGNTWSNMFGILLTNSFSIIGTIMGVKYATESRDGSNG
jgi:hypothetical protein